eukprot:scaffold175535_cov30-Tisochrysis_lutea.AAC.2
MRERRLDLCCVRTPLPTPTGICTQTSVTSAPRVVEYRLLGATVALSPQSRCGHSKHHTSANMSIVGLVPMSNSALRDSKASNRVRSSESRLAFCECGPGAPYACAIGANAGFGTVVASDPHADKCRGFASGATLLASSTSCGPEAGMCARSEGMPSEAGDTPEPDAPSTSLSADVASSRLHALCVTTMLPICRKAAMTPSKSEWLAQAKLSRRPQPTPQRGASSTWNSSPLRTSTPSSASRGHTLVSSARAPGANVRTAPSATCISRS